MVVSRTYTGYIQAFMITTVQLHHLIKFQKADSDLNYISLRLETEFSQQFAENGHDQVCP